jgi:hypothetical protein
VFLQCSLQYGSIWALRPGLAGSCCQAGLEAKVGLAHRHSILFHLLQINSKSIPFEFKASKFCSHSNEIDKNMKSILLIEFKHNI